MPAISFEEKWINKLLRGDKQQTTRPQTTRIWKRLDAADVDSDQVAWMGGAILRAGW